MIYAQIKGGGKLHLVCEAGEEFRGQVIRKDHVSRPLCGASVGDDGYRMTINVPLAHSCKRCQQVYRAGKFQT
ncbi:MAG: hypothetical protein AAGA36_00065 [Pseudomonadota bacterium]